MRCAERRGSLIPFLLALLLASAVIAAGASAQGTQYRLCSVPGSSERRPCQTEADCPGGACVLAQGVCDDHDGFQCDCLDGSCSDCAAGVQCVATQMICGDGTPCLRSTQCQVPPCQATGRVCVGDSPVSCEDDADCCPHQSCLGACLPLAPTPTASVTPIRSSPTPAASATLPPASGPPAHIVEAMGEGAGCAVAGADDRRCVGLLMGALVLGLTRRWLRRRS